MLEKVKVYINDEVMEIQKGITINKLLEIIGILNKMVAIAINGEIVNHSDFEKVKLEGEEKIIIVEAVQGG